MKREVKRSGGFTLVELVVSLALLCVIIALTMSLILTSMNTMTRGVLTSEAHQLGDSLFDSVADSLRFAGNVSVRAEDADYSSAVTVTDGLVTLDTGDGFSPLYARDLYDGMTASISVLSCDQQNATVTMELSLTSNGRVMFRRSGSVALLNIARGGGTVFMESASTMRDPIISFE